MYLFDTDVLSNIVKSRPSQRLLSRLSGLPRELQFSTAINVGEIHYGASRVDHGPAILQVFEERVFPNIDILPFDEESAKVYGRTKAKLERRGISKSEPDLRIAAIALQYGLTLVTGNTKHFEDIPRLKVEDWVGD